MFLNPERSMSHSTEQESENAESSHWNIEYHFDADDTKLEKASTASDNDVFASIWYPSLPATKNLPLCFSKPYLHHQDFKDSDQALRYIMRYFNCQTIHQSLKSFPNLYNDFIYSNTYVETHCFDSLQHYIKTIRALCVILHIHTKPLHCSMYPIVEINFSAPALNTCSHRRVLLANVNPAKIQQQAIDQRQTDNSLHFFTLHDHQSIVQLPQFNTALYQLNYAGEHVINEWREVKKERARKRKERERRKKAEKMVKLHWLLNRELCKVHKLSTNGRCRPMKWWPVVEEWEEVVVMAKVKKEEWSIPLKVKKEEPSSPKIPIKVEELPTPQLLYPSHPSRYTSLDPNTFSWGENAMVN